MARPTLDLENQFVNVLFLSQPALLDGGNSDIGLNEVHLPLRGGRPSDPLEVI